LIWSHRAVFFIRLEMAVQALSAALSVRVHVSTVDEMVRASLVDRIFGNSLRYAPDSMNDALVCDRHRRLRHDNTRGKNGT
jgi:hypothetical protein